MLFDPLTETDGPERPRELYQGNGDRRRNQVVRDFALQHQDGVAVFRSVRCGRGQPGAGAGRGISVSLVTNSLASTDEPWVYVGYWPHIHELLKSGATICERSHPRMMRAATGSASLEFSVAYVDTSAPMIACFQGTRPTYRGCVFHAEVVAQIKSQLASCLSKTAFEVMVALSPKDRSWPSTIGRRAPTKRAGPRCVVGSTKGSRAFPHLHRHTKCSRETTCRS